MTMKLNIGCNEWKLDGFVNTDIDPAMNPDLLHDATTPFPHEDESMEEIYLGHMLEHVGVQDGYRLLDEVRRMLKKGGFVTVTVPDTEKGIRLYNDGKIEKFLLQQIVMGNQNPEDKERHKTVYTESLLRNQLREVFGNVENVDKCPHWVADVEWQTTMLSRK